MDSFDCIADGDSANEPPAQDYSCIGKDDFSNQNTVEPKHDPLPTLFAVAANDRTIDEQQVVWRSSW
jgi:hypothetical protein